jgi:hypothetical protein
MTTSDYFLLMACVFLAPSLSKGWALFLWALNMAFFAVFFVLEKSA